MMLFLFLCSFLSFANSETLIDIDVDDVLSETSDKFIGVTIDTGLIRANWHYFDFSSPKVQTLAKALSPCYVRVGGTDADFLLFDPSSEFEGPFEKQEEFDVFYERHKRDVGLYDVDKKFVNFTMTAKVWDELHTFMKKVGWDLIFDLNALFRTDNKWNSSNAEELMKYTLKKGYKMAGWELGNEPDEYGTINSGYNVTCTDFANDFSRLSQLLQMQQPAVRGSILIGPSSIPLVQLRAIEFFGGFLKAGAGKIVTNPNFHHYYLDGRTATINDFISPKVLNGLQNEMDVANLYSSHYADGKKVWIGETASAYGGGAMNLSNAYVGAFMWLDKLGLAAKSNIGALMRQAFYGGSYGLLDFYTLDPNPDFWLTVLYKRMVGGKVFKVSTSDKSEKIRFYAHCTSKSYSSPGSLTVYGMNLHDDYIAISLAQYANMYLHVYIMTAPGSDLKSRFVSLNGRVLKMISDTELPDLMTPLYMKGKVLLPPMSYVFIVIPKASVAECLH